MIKSLLWKEWRETRLFFFIMALIILIFSLLLNNMDYVNETKSGAYALIYILIWAFFAVLIAAIQFAGEGESGTLNFLLSRPVNWAGVWLFKITYGTASLILFGLFVYIMSIIFIAPLLYPDTLVQTLLQNSTGFTEIINSRGVLLVVSILSLYFICCIISTNMQSSFKAILWTFLASTFLFILLLCSYPVLHFKASHYLYWLILFIFLFIILIRYRSSHSLTNIYLRLLFLGGTAFWAITSIKGISLWALQYNITSYRRFTIDTSEILFSSVFFGIFLSAILTSLFAFGILRRAYPLLWKNLGCWNLLTVVAICLLPSISLVTPREQNIEFEFDRYYWSNIDYRTLPLVVKNSYYSRIKQTPQYRYYLYDQVAVPGRHLVLDRDKGKATPYGKDNLMLRYFQKVSHDNQRVIYSSPLLRWGIYYEWGIWAEDLKTSKRYLLISINNLQGLGGEWFYDGERFILIHGDNIRKLMLFSITDKGPHILIETEISNNSDLIQHDKKDRLYFYDSGKKTVTCYNNDLVKEYEKNIIGEKLAEFENEFDDGVQRRIYSSDPRVSINGNYLFFSIYGYETKRDPLGKRLIRERKNQAWYVSLTDFTSKNFDDLNFDYYYYRWMPFRCHPLANNLLLQDERSGAGIQKLCLIDLKNSKIKTLVEEETSDGWRLLTYEWSGDGRYFLLYCNTSEHNKMMVRPFSFDLETLSCQPVLSRPDLEFERTQHLWSTDGTKTVFQSLKDREIWRLDLNAGKWHRIICPFDNYRILGISNNGEVFVTPGGRPQIFRLTENQTDIIY